MGISEILYGKEVLNKLNVSLIAPQIVFWGMIYILKSNSKTE